MSLEKKLQRERQAAVEAGMTWMAQWWEEALNDTPGVGEKTKQKIMNTVREKAEKHRGARN